MAETTKRIILTGIAGRLGRLVAKRLHRLGGYEVVGLDRRPMHGLPKDVQQIQVDLRSRHARDVFRAGSVDAVIHLGLIRDTGHEEEEEVHNWNVLGTARLLEHCSDFAVRKVVVLSSAVVYGPRPENNQLLSEDAPLLASQHAPGIRDLVEADMQATSFFWRTERGRQETVVLRPVHVLGALHNVPSDYLRLPRIPVVMGYDPMVQVVHEEDVADAVVQAMKPQVHGVLNITGPGEVPLSVVIQELDKPRLPIPSPLFEQALRALTRLHVTHLRPPELNHLIYTCMVDGSRARAMMGYRPHYSLRETIRSVLVDDPQ